MIHDTFGTLDLDMLAAMLWEAGWDHEQGVIYHKEYRNKVLRGRLEMRDNYYALVAL